MDPSVLAQDPEAPGLIMSTWGFFFGSSVNAGLTLVCAYLIYRLLRSDNSSRSSDPAFQYPPPMEKQNISLADLRKYDGNGEDGRILIAILGKIYDVTKGRKFYGPGAPYASFAGRDATRALATFNVTAIKDEWDDCTDLDDHQKSQVEEWEAQIKERYDFVGKLIPPGGFKLGSLDNPDPLYEKPLIEEQLKAAAAASSASSAEEESH